MTEIGHNPPQRSAKSIIERVERLEDIKQPSAATSRTYAEAWGNGDEGVCAIVRYRKEDAQDRAEREAIFETYLNALGAVHEPHRTTSGRR